MASDEQLVGAADWFQTLAGCFDRAVQATELCEKFVHLGPWRVQLRSAGPIMANQVLQSLRPASAGPEPDLQIDLWDSRGSGVPLPFTDTSLPEYDGVTRVFWLGGANCLHALQLEARRAIVWTPDASALPYHFQASPLSLLLHACTNGSNLQVVHAGGVGWETGGVLLTGKSGSGKSTSSLACLQSSLNWAGDDMVLVDVEQGRAYSLFGSAKLERDGLFRLPWLEPYTDQWLTRSGKAVARVGMHLPHKILPSFPIKAILLPRVTGLPQTRITPAKAQDAFHAMAPSTVLQLRMNGERSLAQIARLSRAFPAYWLESGTDIPSIPAAIEEFLQR